MLEINCKLLLSGSVQFDVNNLDEFISSLLAKVVHKMRANRKRFPISRLRTL